MTTQITNFTKERYLSRDYLEREWENMWTKTWLFAGLASDVGATGDYFLFNIRHESIIVTRTQSGEISAFYNVCKHRGNRLIPTTELFGTVKSFRCAYHAWTYDLDGRIKSVPDQHRFSKGIPTEKLSLKQLPLAEWHGLIFISLNDDPIPFDEFMGPMTEQIAPYHMEKMTLVSDQSCSHECNWKAMLDNFAELYHVDYIHPLHKSFVDCPNAESDMLDHGHSVVRVHGGTVNPRYPIPNEATDMQSAQMSALGLDPNKFSGNVMDIRQAIQAQKRKVGRAKGYDYTTLADEQLSDIWQYNLFPNIILALTPEFTWIMRAMPHPTDPQKAYFEKFDLSQFADPALIEGEAKASKDAPFHFVVGGVKPDDYQRPARDFFHHDKIINGEKSMTVTIDEDIHLLGGVQEGMRSRAFEEVWLSDDELRVQHLHNHIDQMVEGG
jgi:phenylpropionate dioxygenase-like ring-hydroxylating dioxygenase large terminal subunit